MSIQFTREKWFTFAMNNLKLAEELTFRTRSKWLFDFVEFVNVPHDLAVRVEKLRVK